MALAAPFAMTLASNPLATRSWVTITTSIGLPVQDRAQHDDSAAQLVPEPVSHLAQRVCVGSRGLDGQYRDSGYLLLRGQQRLGLLEMDSPLQRLPLSSELLDLVQQPLYPGLHLRQARLKPAGEPVLLAEPVPHQLLRGPAADSLEAPHSGSDAGLAKDVDGAHLAGEPDVGAAADLEAEGVAVGDLDQPHPVAVLVSEEGQGPPVDGR